MAGPGGLRSSDPPNLGRYVLEGRLGEGGQGVVYLGRDEGGRQVAVKLLRTQLSGDQAMRARFARELSVIEKVAGFCTAQVLDADIAGDQPYIVSEYVPGPSLQESVAEHGPRGGNDLHRLAVGTATALAAIHRTGIVHRDFKPPNILMASDGPRVIDFGIARALEFGADSTIASGVVGTPSYMAPEQIAGGRITAAADVFAWGATLVFAAAGRPPFRGDGIPAVIHQIVNGVPDLSGLPDDLHILVERCLAKDPALRPSSQELLLTLLGGQPATPPPPQGAPQPALPPPSPPPQLQLPQPPQSQPPRLQPEHQPWPQAPSAPKGRNRTWWIVAGAAAAVIAVSTAGVLWNNHRADADRGGRGGDSAAQPVGLPADGPEAVAAAGLAVRNFTSYHYLSYDADLQRTRADLAEEFWQKNQSSLQQRRTTATRQKTIAEGTVVAAGLERMAPGRAGVLVVLHRKTRQTGSPERLDKQAIRVEMLSRKGRWLVSELTLLPAPQSSGTDPWPAGATSSLFKDAGECAAALVTVDHKTIDADLAKVTACATGGYATEWARSAAQIKTAAVNAKSSTRSLGVETAIVQADAVKATVIVQASSQATGPPAGAGASRDHCWRLTMDRVDGRWRISNLDQIV
ncbi:serine/threonine-protein kinase [Actinomadura hibisca]|uniref:serine/threonine-protein kinase n=1 Tax=Actinomadura hibisca TaxID=68565 RepID=UPI00083367BC|nr:serine/threonine-protein kinase [Actinomadura hibisca]